jgi:hypothetical protein
LDTIAIISFFYSRSRSKPNGSPDSDRKGTRDPFSAFLFLRSHHNKTFLTDNDSIDRISARLSAVSIENMNSEYIKIIS